jgi:hypothetical protein
MNETFLMLKTPLETSDKNLQAMSDNDHLLILGMLASGVDKGLITQTLYLSRGFWRKFYNYHGISKNTAEKHSYRVKGYSVEFNPFAEKRRVAYRHRKVAEDMLGRPLRRDEHVHHLDMDPGNNNWGNLLVCNPSRHHCLHAQAKELVTPLATAGVIKYDHNSEKYAVDWARVLPAES